MPNIRRSIQVRVDPLTAYSWLLSYCLSQRTCISGVLASAHSEVFAAQLYISQEALLPFPCHCQLIYWGQTERQEAGNLLSHISLLGHTLRLGGLKERLRPRLACPLAHTRSAPLWLSVLDCGPGSELARVPNAFLAHLSDHSREDRSLPHKDLSLT